MFSVKEKIEISKKVEEVLPSFKHPEMPTENVNFRLHIDGKEGWSWADIEPNWKFGPSAPATANPWNEVSREVMGGEKK